MNRFFKNDDKKVESVGDFKLPVTWWSRPYEYYFCMEMLNDDDVVLDVGCGVEHPFKHYAGEKCLKVTALDLDERVLQIKDDNVEFIICDILHYKTDLKFDKIFAISTLEHSLNNLEEKFENMKNLLKKDGKIILTVDYPTLAPERIIECAKKANLKTTTEFNYDRTDEVVNSLYGLSVYSVTLEHDRQDKMLKANDRKTKIL